MNKKFQDIARQVIQSTSVIEQMHLLADHGIDICREIVKDAGDKTEIVKTKDIVKSRKGAK